MLKQRVITAFAMLFIFLFSLFVLPLEGFTLFICVLFLLGAWEWSNLAGIKSNVGRLLFTLLTFAIALIIAWYSRWSQDMEALQAILLVGCAWWVFSLFWIQGFPSSAIIWGSSIMRALMGWFVLIPAWLACIYLRAENNGAWLILMVVFIIAAADIGAYFTGRAVGKRKLAPNVSPGKSWEGVVGGMVFAVIIGMAFNWVFGRDQWFILLLILIPTALISVIGDLLESMVKRHRGVKDSSQLLPGHGGVLDRIDGLVAAAPVFALALLMTSYQL